MIRLFESLPSAAAQRLPSLASGPGSQREGFEKPRVEPPWLSAVPSVDAAVSPELRLVSCPSAPPAQMESFRLLAHRMESLRRDQGANRLIVTSAVPGDGKTFVASNLAVTLARQAGAVLLVDGDVRGAHLEQALGVPRQSGLAEVLRGDITLSQALRKVSPHGVFLLGAGDMDPHTPDLLAGPRFVDFLRELKDVFRWIILDSPPLLPVVDALAMTKAADAALLIARRDHTPRSAIDGALRLLRSHPIAGVVLNDAEDRSASSYYAYRSYPNRPPHTATESEEK